MTFSLVRKLVLGILIVSTVTYSTSAFFIFQLKPILAPDMTDWIYITGVLVLGILWTCFLGWLAAQFLIRPLLRLTKVVDIVASGNLNITIPPYSFNDEIKQLHQSFQLMLNNLRQMIADVSDSVAVTDRSATTLGSAIGQATNQIETIALTIERMAEGAAIQADSAQQMLHSAEQTAETAQDINNEAERAIDIAGTMVGTISANAAQLRSLVDGMLHISETSEKTLDIVRNLEVQAGEISQISQLVSQIADQTHLLALNASIEAAHAGEQGQGFAIVAQHIRKLAADSAAAGEHINQLVGQMQEQTLTVVNETDKQVRLIRHETTIGENAKLVLDEVVSSVHETASALQSIVEHITIQTGQINSTFDKAKNIAGTAFAISEGGSHISSAAQDQTAVMQEISASSELLLNEAQGLKQKTVVFVVN
ncbi:methyl-accepting chemotaxis protein [Paenibacillus castaneae]|uniref:methyl-accepting chemotaxis protein n=1 Tax=Paenibacillus castaneae TaxID=474957 RepID=UPI000C9A1994|nr:methyl-accepting chemotaxis protein [Paenibacillus castaneae]NIK79689.1 methyl-accepting chemotaxis protein [Paenibacillus castaneae]